MKIAILFLSLLMSSCVAVQPTAKMKAHGNYFIISKHGQTYMVKKDAYDKFECREIQ